MQTARLPCARLRRPHRAHYAVGHAYALAVVPHRARLALPAIGKIEKLPEGAFCRIFGPLGRNFAFGNVLRGRLACIVSSAARSIVATADGQGRP